mgnify:CR=1 FL=1
MALGTVNTSCVSADDVEAVEVEEALSLYDEGADYVILPHFLGGEHFSVLIEDFTDDVNRIIKTMIM